MDAATIKERDEFKQTFAKIQEQVLPESEINTPHPEQADLVSSEDNTYEVESILAKRRTNGGKVEYLVHWKSYLLVYEEATWEPTAHLTGCMDLVRRYEAKYGDDEAQEQAIPTATKRARTQQEPQHGKKRRTTTTSDK